MVPYTIKNVSFLIKDTVGIMAHQVEMVVLMLKYLEEWRKLELLFCKLEKRVWSDRGITTNTKLSVYED